MDQKSIKALREEWGFVITDDRDPDLMGWLAGHYFEAKEAAGESPKSAKAAKQEAVEAGEIQKFVEFARKMLRDNPPTTMTYLPRGLALQLANHQQVVLVDSAIADDQDNTMAKGVQGITTSNRGGGGIPGFKQTNSSVPVTGRPKK